MNASILIVDDDLDIAINMFDVLNDLGYEADIANDGRTALSLIRGKTYDIALLDFKMPDMDGAELYSRIKELQPSIVAIMLTAYAETDGVERALSAGTWTVLRKPIDFDVLLGYIRQVTP
jgi:DNA-binding response OmpR family regulator